MNNLSTATSFRKGLLIQCQPRMLFAVLLPLIITMMAFVFLLVTAWSPLDNWLFESATQWSWFQKAQSSLEGWGFSTMSEWISHLLSLISISALSVIIGLAGAAIIVTPLAVKFISQHHFPNLEKKGKHANSISIYNAIKVSAIFIIGWLLTLPLWFFPMMPIVLSLFWGAYAFAYMSRVDAMVEHATKEERLYILTTRNKGFWTIGLVCAAISLIPFMGLVMPVFSIIVCTHYGLNALDSLRKNTPTTT